MIILAAALWFRLYGSCFGVVHGEQVAYPDSVRCYLSAWGCHFDGVLAWQTHEVDRVTFRNVMRYEGARVIDSGRLDPDGYIHREPRHHQAHARHTP